MVDHFSMDLPVNAMTPRMRRILISAAQHAKASDQRFIGTEHVLLALAGDKDGLAGQILSQLSVREAVQAMAGDVVAAPGAGHGEAGHPDDEVRVQFDSVPESNHPLRLCR